MTVRYNPGDAAPPLLEDGWYDATTIAAEERASKQDNMMIDTTFRVFSGGTTIALHLYFVEGSQASLSRLKKLCKLIGVDFDAGEVQADQLTGHDLSVYIKTRTDKTGQYEDQNVIAKMAVRGDTKAVSSNDTPDDDIPF